jgi:hypothetical protein
VSPVIAVATRSRPKVFVTSSALDHGLAEQVASVLDASGVEVVRIADRNSLSRGEGQLRDAIRRSAAVVAVVSRSTTSTQIPASVFVEIGAATGAGKPVFIVLEDPTYRVNFSVPDMHILPISRVDEIGQSLADLDG